MKSIVFTYLFLTALTGWSMVALPPAGGTNELAAIERANRINVEWANYYYQNGQLARLETETTRLENEFQVLAVVISSTFASLATLAVRDWIRQRKCTGSEKTADERRTKTD